MTFWISALLFITGVGASLRLRTRRGRRSAAGRGRRVEHPNSHYAAPGVRRLVDLERWERIPLRQLHAVNRDEASRLFALAKVVGPDALTAEERRFLDNLARQA